MRIPTFLFAIFLNAFFYCLPLALGGGVLDHPSLGDRGYPVALAAIENGQLLEIVAADAARQVALDAGGRSIGFDDTKLLFAKGAGFAEGELKIASSQAHILRDEPHESASAYRSKGSDGTLIEATLIPTRNYSNVVMAAVFYSFEGRREVSAESIGDLVAGQETYVSLLNPEDYDYANQEIEYTLLFFSDQGEIVSDFRKRSGMLIDQMFEEFYRELVYEYQVANEQSNRNASLVHRYPINFAGLEKALSKQHGSTSFVLNVNEMGIVTNVETVADLASPLRERCERSFREWLFLPQIRDGFAEPSRVSVPVHWD